ncbi:Crp/Fnr family transcriptional regulator, partial [Lactobacillus delbrueckii subsp. bulgaricus]|nr:Crp/Fnr family transcriptional regulator [Lactobacillus delbrueckii subsp. bulgaricus]
MHQHDELNCISHVPFFKNLPLDLRQDLVHISTHQQFFKKGSLIHAPGDGRLSVMSLDSGRAKVYSLSPDGH